MPTVDDNKNIQRIINVIKSNPDILAQTKDDGLLQFTQIGNPQQMKPQTNYMPYCYVTVDDPLQKTSYQYGVTTPENISQITVGYKIVIVSDKAGMLDTESVKDAGGYDQVTAEKKLYNLLNLMRNTLSADPTFKNPDSDDDPIFTRSIINESSWEKDFVSNDKESVGKGRPVQLIKFTLLATIGSIGTIKMSTVNDDTAIEIISESPDAEIEGYASQFNDQLILQGYAPTGSTRSKNIEIEHIELINRELRTLKQTRKPFILTFTDTDGTETSESSVISQLTSNVQGIGSIKVDLIQFLLIP